MQVRGLSCKWSSPAFATEPARWGRRFFRSWFLHNPSERDHHAWAVTAEKKQLYTKKELLTIRSTHGIPLVVSKYSFETNRDPAKSRIKTAPTPMHGYLG